MPNKRRLAPSADGPDSKIARNSKGGEPAATATASIPLEKLTKRLTRHQLESIVLQTPEKNAKAERTIRALIEPMYEHATLSSAELRQVRKSALAYTVSSEFRLFDIYLIVQSIMTTVGTELYRDPPKYDRWLLWRRAINVMIQIGNMVEGMTSSSGRFGTGFSSDEFWRKLNDKMTEVMDHLDERLELVQLEEIEVLADQVLKLDHALAKHKDVKTSLSELAQRMSNRITENGGLKDDSELEDEDE